MRERGGQQATSRPQALVPSCLGISHSPTTIGYSSRFDLLQVWNLNSMLSCYLQATLQQVQSQQCNEGQVPAIIRVHLARPWWGHRWPCSNWVPPIPLTAVWQTQSCSCVCAPVWGNCSCDPPNGSYASLKGTGALPGQDSWQLQPFKLCWSIKDLIF